MASSSPEPAAGFLLVAPPIMADPNFFRSVVLLCEHGAEGSFGLILNRILSLHLEEVLEDVERYPDPIALGGPVQPDTLHFLHRHGNDVINAVPVLNDVYWGGDFEQIKALVRDGRTSAQNLRFFLGYAGWSDGQLENEIGQGGWILAEARPEEIFAENPASLWRTVLRRMGGEYAVLANFPDDPSMN
jgi:putative transcriptional regulator